MKENSVARYNFDCSQLISFRWEGDEPPQLIGLDLFKEIGFVILLDDAIRKVKKNYFRLYDGEYFLELADNDFVGDIQEWVGFDSPPERIVKFSQALLNLKEANKLMGARLLISVFSEKGRTSNNYVSIKSSQLMEALYIMSGENFELWDDNLIISFID